MPVSGSTTDRGYGGSHQRERRRWAPKVAAGRVVCWRCGRAIAPGAPWDLGHVDGDKSLHRGPEHRRCSRQAGAVRGNGMRRARRGKRLVSNASQRVSALRW